jgi:hypothetical protein
MLTQQTKLLRRALAKSLPERERTKAFVDLLECKFFLGCECCGCHFDESQPCHVQVNKKRSEEVTHNSATLLCMFCANDLDLIDLPLPTRLGNR